MIPVLGKVPCLFEYLRDEAGKPLGGTANVLAAQPSASAIVTAKLHGTCCYIKNGAIYARQDVRNDISKAPADWFPTAGGLPDRGGHIIGFRPLDRKRGDRWHLEAIHPEDPSLARFLEYDATSKKFFYVWRPIAEFNGKTAELVGPKINANAHGLEHHAYSIHGAVIVDAPWRTHAELRGWLDSEEGCIYEGIVIHDPETGKLFKCHRGHLGGDMHWKGGYPLPMRNDV